MIFLIQLDGNNAVLSCTDVSTGMIPMLTLFDPSYLLTQTPVVAGQVFDPVTQSFTEAPRKRWITKLALDNRFTMAEATKLKLAQVYPARLPDELDADYALRCALPSQLQVMASRLAMATYIDLNRADTRGGIQLLEQAGLLGVGRALEILDGEIGSHEYHPDA